MKESETHRRDDRELRKRARGVRMIGLAAGALTTVAVLGAGYLTINYMQNRQRPQDPAIPAQVATVERTEAQTPEETEPAKTQSSTLPSESGSSENGSDEAGTETKKQNESSGEASTEAAESEAGTAAETTEEETTEEETTEEETTEEETLSPEDAADRKLRMEAINKYDHLGIVVNVNNYLNMRTGPSTNDELCGKIFRYCAVNILETLDNGWYKIESGGVTGYVAQQYIQDGDKAVKLALEHCRYQATILVDNLPVRQEANEAAETWITVRKGDIFDVLSYKGDWVEVEAVETLSGYVPANTISVSYRLEEAIVFGYDDSVSQLRIDIINKGFDYYGGKYVFGGESLTDGIDCSAFTQQIYGMFNIELLRNSYAQCTQGVEVKEEDIRPGDLIFYTGRYAGMVGHVAIYIGNGKILHAASESKGICVGNWKFVPIVTIRNVIGD